VRYAGPTAATDSTVENLLIALIEPQSRAQPFCPLTCRRALIEAHPHAKLVSSFGRPRNAIFALSQPPSRAAVPTHKTNCQCAADGGQDQQSHEYGPVGLPWSSYYPPIRGGLGGGYSRPPHKWASGHIGRLPLPSPRRRRASRRFKHHYHAPIAARACHAPDGPVEPELRHDYRQSMERKTLFFRG
jgi:hypothetical protein